jgi:hypothetical protein
LDEFIIPLVNIVEHKMNRNQSPSTPTTTKKDPLPRLVFTSLARNPQGLGFHEFLHPILTTDKVAIPDKTGGIPVSNKSLLLLMKKYPTCPNNIPHRGMLQDARNMSSMSMHSKQPSMHDIMDVMHSPTRSVRCRVLRCIHRSSC